MWLTKAKRIGDISLQTRQIMDHNANEIPISDLFRLAINIFSIFHRGKNIIIGLFSGHISVSFFWQLKLFIGQSRPDSSNLTHQ